MCVCATGYNYEVCKLLILHLYNKYFIVAAIQGSTKRAVSTTYKIIQNKIYNARMRTDSTHFISFPVNSSDIQKSFSKFKDEILNKYKGVSFFFIYNYIFSYLFICKFYAGKLFQLKYGLEKLAWHGIFCVSEKIRCLKQKSCS